jgi:hypothetical protein
VSAQLPESSVWQVASPPRQSLKMARITTTLRRWAPYTVPTARTYLWLQSGFRVDAIRRANAHERLGFSHFTAVSDHGDVIDLHLGHPVQHEVEAWGGVQQEILHQDVRTVGEDEQLRPTTKKRAQNHRVPPPKARVEGEREGQARARCDPEHLPAAGSVR